MERAAKYMANDLDAKGMKNWGLDNGKHEEQLNLPNQSAVCSSFFPV